MPTPQEPGVAAKKAFLRKAIDLVEETKDKEKEEEKLARKAAYKESQAPTGSGQID